MGCRCQECKDAQNLYQFHWRLSKQLDDLRERLQLEDWQVDLERAARIDKYMDKQARR